MIVPLKIAVKEKKILHIDWNDNSESDIKLVNLRRYCPCALCISEREEQGSMYIPIYSDSQLSIKEIRVVGNYALEISWQDDHCTGIYDFGYLKNLSRIEFN